MADALSPPPDSAKSRFRGGIASFGVGIYASWPFGYLEFDDHELTIFGAGKRAHGQRDAGARARISRGILSVRVSIVDGTDDETDFCFTALSRKAIRAELQRRGWPVLEDHRIGRHRPGETR